MKKEIKELREESGIRVAEYLVGFLPKKLL